MERFRVGLIVPSSNTVMEPDVHRALGGRAAISTTRIFLEQVTRDAEVRMIEEDLPRSVRLINTTAPHVTVFGCTSAGSLGGLEHDTAIAQKIEQGTGTRAVTVLGAVMSQLRSLGPRTVAVFTPYREDLTRSVADSIAEGGYTVVSSAGMGILENREIGQVTPAEIVGFVASRMSAPADCAFLSCTNWQAVGAIEQLRMKLGIPVISSNQAAIDEVSRVIDSPGRVS